jgi:aerobic carbon-monoxide dehydrogenase medium subunit
MRPFELAEPDTLDEAVRLLDPDDPASRAIAGGTALMLMMKAGVFQPSRLVSLRGIEARHRDFSLDGGALNAGPMVPLGALERSAEVARAFPVIADTLRVLSNSRVRNVATVGGNLAHADPLMDLPPVLAALGGEVEAIGPSGARRIAVEDLFVGYYETTLEPDELIAVLHVPALAGRRAAYRKCTTRAAHDWPALGVAVSIDLQGDRIRQARIVVSAAVEVPARMKEAEAVLDGAAATEEAFREAGDAAARAAEVIADVRGSAPYKRQLIRVNVARALRQAATGTEARGGTR